MTESTTVVQRVSPTKYVVVHDGCVYVDRLRTREQMVRLEEERIMIHVKAARVPKGKLERMWRFQLRNNAAIRRAAWASE